MVSRSKPKLTRIDASSLSRIRSAVWGSFRDWYRAEHRHSPAKPQARRSLNWYRSPIQV